VDPAIQFDADRALPWFEKAYAQGHKTAGTFMAGLHATSLVKQPKVEFGLKLLQDLEDEGIGAAKFWLGQYYAALESNRVDRVRALGYFIEAHDLNITPTPSEKAIALVRWIVIEADDRERSRTIELLESRAKQSCLANSLLAEMYLHAGDAHPDYARAKSILEDGAQRKCVTSIVKLGDLYRTGQGVTNDPVKALDLYSSVAPQSADAATRIAGSLFAASLSNSAPDGTNAAAKLAYGAAYEAAMMGSSEAFDLISRILAADDNGLPDAQLMAYGWAVLAAEQNPNYDRAAKLEKDLTREQLLEGVRYSQFFKMEIRKRAIQNGEGLFRF
jgi:TPR repeat protein